jgi:hypothetical protein
MNAGDINMYMDLFDQSFVRDSNPVEDEEPETL